MKPWLFNNSRNWFIELRFFEWPGTVSRILKSRKQSKSGLCSLLKESTISDTWFINMAQTSYVEIEKYFSGSLSKSDPRRLAADGLALNILYTL